MVDHEDDQVADRDERNDAGILERVQSFQETQWNNNQHKGSDPEVPVDQERISIGVCVEAPHDARHQVANDD